MEWYRRLPKHTVLFMKRIIEVLRKNLLLQIASNSVILSWTRFTSCGRTKWWQRCGQRYVNVHSARLRGYNTLQLKCQLQNSVSAAK